MTDEIILRIAMWLYKKNVAAAQWYKEQESMKTRFIIQAQDMVKELEQEGLSISEISQTASKSKSRQKKVEPPDA